MEVFGNLSEHPAQLEKPFAVAGVTDAAADEEGTEGRFGQQTSGNIVGELAAGGHAVHFSDFVGANGVDFFPEQRRRVTKSRKYPARIK